MRYPSVAKLAQGSWFPFSDEPVLSSQWFLPKLCDPAFLFPEESPDQKWHMFAHSWVGIHHFVSDSGIAWEPMKMVVVRGHSPFIFFDRGTWYLLYEKHNAPIPIVEMGFGRRLRRKERLKASRIEMLSSNDLVMWSEPRLLLDSRDVSFASDYLEHPRVSRPQLVATDTGYDLYFGASHVVLPDTHQKVSRYFAMAHSESLAGPFVLTNENKPLLEPMPDDADRNLAVGSLKIVPGADGLMAFECGASWDPEAGRTITRMTMLGSLDGKTWNKVPRPPVLVHADRGWADGYVMGCDVRYKSDEECWYCYFSANNAHAGKRWARESLGLLIGTDRALKKRS